MQTPPTRCGSSSLLVNWGHSIYYILWHAKSGGDAVYLSSPWQGASPARRVSSRPSRLMVTTCTLLNSQKLSDLLSTPSPVRPIEPLDFVTLQVHAGAS